MVAAASSAFLVALWLLTGGTTDALQRITSDPTVAVQENFWPIWVILAWLVALVTHVGIYMSIKLFGRKARKTRKDVAVDAARTGIQLAREATTVVQDAVERRQSRRHGDRGGPGRGKRQRREIALPKIEIPGVRRGTSGPEKRWVTVMFSDVTDSTSHNEKLGDDEWHRLLGRYRTTVRGAVADRGGTEVGTAGDGVLARFSSPADAVLCGIDIQSSLGKLRAGGEFTPEVKIGIHAGEAVEDEGDLIGRVINLASRVTDEARPGEILVTEPVADQLVGTLSLEDRGLRELKGMSQPRHLLAVVWTDAGD